MPPRCCARHGRVATYRKHRLPNYEVFDEQRYFAAGYEPCVVEVKGVRLRHQHLRRRLGAGRGRCRPQAGAELLLALNASPYHMNKQATRYEVLRERIADRHAGALRQPGRRPGRAGVRRRLLRPRRDGRLAYQLPQFEALESSTCRRRTARRRVAPARPLEAEVYEALVLGVRDYVGKNGFPGALLGLSGGIDSALTLAIAVDALGADKVRAVMMPSPYTAQMSLDDARAMARNARRALRRVSHRAGDATVRGDAGEGIRRPRADTTEENLQARIRGMLLMALSNKYGSIVLTTGNKSEMAVGYATLYGDMAGGFAVIKDIYKTLVYRLSRYRNGCFPVIPERIITRAPSAELRPTRPTRTRCRPTRCSTPSSRPTWNATSRRARSSPGLRMRGRRAAHGRHAQAQRIQAAPGAGRHPRDAARLWQGLAISDNIGLRR
jgi:NAD+ synthetase